MDSCLFKLVDDLFKLVDDLFKLVDDLPNADFFMREFAFPHKDLFFFILGVGLAPPDEAKLLCEIVGELVFVLPDISFKCSDDTTSLFSTELSLFIGLTMVVCSVFATTSFWGLLTFRPKESFLFIFIDY